MRGYVSEWDDNGGVTGSWSLRSSPPRPATFVHYFPLEPTTLAWAARGMNDQPSSDIGSHSSTYTEYWLAPGVSNSKLEVHSLYLFGSQSIVEHQHSQRRHGIELNVKVSTCSKVYVRGLAILIAIIHRAFRRLVPLYLGVRNP